MATGWIFVSRLLVELLRHGHWMDFLGMATRLVS